MKRDLRRFRLTARLWARTTLHYYKGILRHISAILMISGIITFSCFIFEESLQTIMFGTWAADQAKDYKLILEGMDRMKRINETMDWYNTWFGWVHPPARSSYKAYHEAADFYIRAVLTKILAVSPETLVGHEIEANFTPATAEFYENYVSISCGQISVFLDEWPQAYPVKIRGVLLRKGDQFTVDMRKSK